MSTNISGKVAIVTGASSGIGTGIAKRYLQEGVKVCLAVRKTEETQKLFEGFGFDPENWFVRKCDVRNLDDIRGTVKDTVERFGTVDIMVANSGIQLRAPFLDVTEEDYDTVLDTNLKGSFFCAQEAGKVMAKKGSGSIIFIGSIGSIEANPNVTTYGASKGGLRVLTMHVALDLGHYGIRCNCIAPGTVRSNINKYRLQDPKQEQASRDVNMLDILAEPEDCGGLAVFLASDDARFITGEQIMLDGGTTVKAAPLWVRS